jgi:hypothetical protein
MKYAKLVLNKKLAEVGNNMRKMMQTLVTKHLTNKGKGKGKVVPVL